MRHQSRTTLCALAILASFGLSAPALAECSGATEALAPMICGSAGLTQAWAGIENKLAALKADHPDLAPQLDQDQALFTTLLEKVLPAIEAAHPAPEQPDILLIGLEDRLTFLNAIDPSPAEGLTGRWENAAGTIHLRPSGDLIQAEIAVHDPIMGLNSCALSAEAAVSQGMLTLEHAPSSEEVSLSQAGMTGPLGVDVTRAGRSAEGLSTCPDSAPISGWYFRTTGVGTM